MYTGEQHFLSILSQFLSKRSRRPIESAQRLNLHRIDHYVNDHGHHIHRQCSVLAKIRFLLVLLLINVDGSQENRQHSLCNL